MMTEEEWGTLVGYMGLVEKHGRRHLTDPLFLAAYKELKERREDQEWCRALHAEVRFVRDGGVHIAAFPDPPGSPALLGFGPTIHAAVTAAKEPAR
jgi:hypothetical protein